MRLLFIGNSHTYFNDMPLLVKKLFSQDGEQCDITMLVKGGESLAFHSKEVQTKFNILYGEYDFIVLQDAGSSFNADIFKGGMHKMSKHLEKVSSKALLYMSWPLKKHPELVDGMFEAYKAASEKYSLPLAAVGIMRREFAAAHPEIELFNTDGMHASPLGSYISAAAIYYLIKNPQTPKKYDACTQTEEALAIPLEIVNDIHQLAFDIIKRYN